MRRQRQSCGPAAHAEMVADPEIWAALEKIGECDDGDGFALELANCALCPQTLARETGKKFVPKDKR